MGSALKIELPPMIQNMSNPRRVSIDISRWVGLRFKTDSSIIYLRDFNEYCLFLIFTPDYRVVKDTHTVDSTEI